MANVLIAGGAGFIGSHTSLVLMEAGHRIVVIDNFATSTPANLQRVRELVGTARADALEVLAGDIRDRHALDKAFATGGGPFDAVIHFAGLKAVAESVHRPLLYWDVNVGGSRSLLAAMADHGCRTLVFSSSATVYGYPRQLPIAENTAVEPINPYGHTKAAVERMLADLAASAATAPAAEGQQQSQVSGEPQEQPWRIACLRYFNPVGAHASGLIGEQPLAPPATCSHFWAR